MNKLSKKKLLISDVHGEVLHVHHSNFFLVRLKSKDGMKAGFCSQPTLTLNMAVQIFTVQMCKANSEIKLEHVSTRVDIADV